MVEPIRGPKYDPVKNAIDGFYRDRGLSPDEITIRVRTTGSEDARGLYKLQNTSLSPLGEAAQTEIGIIGAILPKGSQSAWRKIRDKRRETNLYIGEVVSRKGSIKNGYLIAPENDEQLRARVLSAGAMFEHNDGFNQVHNLTGGDQPQIARAVDAINSAVSTQILLRHKRVSISSFMEQDSASRPLAPYFEFFTEIGIGPLGIDMAQIVRENSYYPLNKDGKYLKNQAYLTSVLIQALFLYSYDDNPLGKLNSQQGKNASRRARQLLGELAGFQDGMREAVFSPTHPEHPEIRSKMIDYLSADSNIYLPALTTMGFSLIKKLYDVYTKARTFELEGVDPDFYHLLAERTLDFARTRGRGHAIVLKEDLPNMFAEDPAVNPGKSVPAEQMADASQAIFARSSRRFFSLDESRLKAVGNFGLINPRNFRITYDQDDPYKMDTVFSLGENGNEYRMQVSFSLNESTVNWNLLALSEEEPVLTQARLVDAVVKFSSASISAIAEDIEGKIISGEAKTFGKSHLDKPLLSLNPNKRKNSSSPGLSAPLTEPEQPAAPSEPSITYTVELAKPLEKLVGNTTEQDLDNMRTALEQLSNGENISLKPLRSGKAGRGRTFWEIDVPGTTRGRNRVVIEEKPNKQAGRRDFKVIGAGFRGEILSRLRDHGLIVLSHRSG